MTNAKPKRGEVWWVSLDPTVGTEIKKTRPAIVVSNDVSNRYLDRVQVVPLTSTIAPVYPPECLVVVRKEQRKAMADQVRTVSLERLVKKIATLSVADMQAVDRILRLQLDV